MPTNEDKFEIQLESDEGLEKLIFFLKKRKYLQSLKSEEINKELRLLKRRLGFRNYEEMFLEIERNPKFLQKVVKSLKDQGETSQTVTSHISMLGKRKRSLKDFINTPEKVPRKKKKKKRRLVDIDEMSFITSSPQDTQNISSILDFLSLKKINYEAYKETYFLRRIQTRMRKLGLETYRDYRNHLENNFKEPNLLVTSFSINVTHFFRDRDLFIELQRNVLPRIMKSKSVRIWSAGCAVGPEPYSIAMLINRLGFKKRENNVNILATDLSQDFLKQAKEGMYPEELLKELDHSEIEEFFSKTDKNEYQLSQSIKDYVIFKKHDLRTDPPSDNFDLILCRNVLIYFSRPQSKRLFERFYSALKPGGYLVIGSCELIHPALNNRFETIDSQNRIYRRI